MSLDSWVCVCVWRLYKRPYRTRFSLALPLPITVTIAKQYPPENFTWFYSFLPVHLDKLVDRYTAVSFNQASFVRPSLLLLLPLLLLELLSFLLLLLLLLEYRLWLKASIDEGFIETWVKLPIHPAAILMDRLPPRCTRCTRHSLAD